MALGGEPPFHSGILQEAGRTSPVHSVTILTGVELSAENADAPNSRVTPGSSRVLSFRLGEPATNREVLDEPSGHRILSSGPTATSGNDSVISAAIPEQLSRHSHRKIVRRTSNLKSRRLHSPGRQLLFGSHSRRVERWIRYFTEILRARTDFRTPDAPMTEEYGCAVSARFDSESHLKASVQCSCEWMWPAKAVDQCRQRCEVTENP